MGNITSRTWLAALLLAAASGCGLSDYERRMQDTHDRFQAMDEENRVLDDLIAMPSGKDPYGNEINVPFVIYLRLPKGVLPKPELVVVHDKLPLYRYPARGDAFKGAQDFNVLLAWAKVTDQSSVGKTATDKPGGDKGAAEKAGTDKGGGDKSGSSKQMEQEFTVEAFRTKVRGALVDYFQRMYSLNANPPDFKKLDAKKYDGLREGKPVKLQFECIAFNDPRSTSPPADAPSQGTSKLLVCFHYTGYQQAALIYQLPAAQAADPNYQRMVEFSLKSVNISTTASGQRSNFTSRKKF